MGVAGPPGDIWMVPPSDGRPWRVRLVRRGRTSPPQGARHDGNPSSPGRGTDGERPQRGPEAVRAARVRHVGDGVDPRLGEAFQAAPAAPDAPREAPPDPPPAPGGGGSRTGPRSSRSSAGGSPPFAS